MSRLLTTLAVVLFLALALGGCGGDDPGSSPSNAVQFPIGGNTNVGIGGTDSYFGFFKATSGTSHTVTLNNLTRNFALFSYGTDSSFSGGGTECNAYDDTTTEVCVIGPTSVNFNYYIRIHNYTASAGSGTVSIN